MKGSEEHPPPDVFPSPDKKGIWIRVPADAADHIDINHVIHPPPDRQKIRNSKPKFKTARPAPPGSQADYILDLTDERSSVDRYEYNEDDLYYKDRDYQNLDFSKNFRSPPPLLTTTPEPYTGPVIGRVLGEILKVRLYCFVLIYTLNTKVMLFCFEFYMRVIFD